MQLADDGVAYVAFPSVPLMLTPVPMRNVSCGALLRLANGTVWLLKTNGQPWTEERIRTAGAVLTQLGVPGVSQQRLEERVAYALEIPRVAIRQPVLSGADAAQWEFRKAAVGVMTRAIHKRAGALAAGEVAIDVAALEKQFALDLGPSIAEFANLLDREAVELATVVGQLDTGLYNYLIRVPARAWRLQFARTFPPFLRAAATGDDESAGRSIRDAVDAGVPLVSHLARVWAVSPGSVRCLIGRSPSLPGTRWEMDPRTLVRLLDQLRPEDRPGDDAETWAQFNKAVEITERIFRRPITASFLSIAWLREAARNRFQAIGSTQRGRSLSVESIAAIDLLRERMIGALAYLAAGQPRAIGGEPRVAAATVTDRRLVELKPGRLAAVAIEFTREHARLQGDLEHEHRLRTGQVFWPLMPENFVSVDGLRRIVALTSRDALMRQGIGMALCIRGGSELAKRTIACAQARAFMVAIVAVPSGLTQSVAEFRIHQPFRGGKYELELVQHRAFGNNAPSTICAKALDELMACARSSELQAHWEAGRRLVHRRGLSTPDAEREAEHRATVQALRTAIGSALFDTAVAQVTEAAGLP